MKYTIGILLLFFLSTHLLKSQNDLIKKDDPILGIWQLSTYDSTQAGGVPILSEDVPMPFLNFKSDADLSWFAALYEKGQGFGCPNYYIAHKNKSKIWGVMKEGCMLGYIGTKFSFNYKCEKTKDSLTIIFKGKSYHYIQYRGL